MVRELEATVPRTCTELRIDARQKTIQRHESKSLSAFRDCTSYVLLGDPGLGKSTSLREEQAALSETSLFLSARDFITFDPANHPEWRDKTLFIDGLDEIRTDGMDPRTPFDRIRQNLDELGKPPFRLSCRHVDWLNTDQKSLECVSSSGSVTVLSLDPLDTGSLTQILARNSQLTDIQAFVLEAHDRGMEAMLTNPQSLLMLADTVSSQGWPSSRKELFEQACQAMAQEFNEEHLNAKHTSDVSQILDDAGRICAVLLLSNTPGCSTSPNYDRPEYPYLNRIGIPIDASKVAIATNLFRAAPNRVEFVHRHVAEFLAARYLASLVERGLPVLRVLSQMTDSHGNVVTSLRGLSSWLAVHSRVSRKHLISRDPVGVALYGDLQDFSDDERFELLHALLSDPLQLEPTDRISKAFAGFVSLSMREFLEQTLKSPTSDSTASIIIDFLLRLFAESATDSELNDIFARFVRDESQPSHVKETALKALISNIHCDDVEATLLSILDEVKNGHISDPDDELLGDLLQTLFPCRISASEIWGYYRVGNDSFMGNYMRFWMHDVLVNAQDTDIAILLDECSVRVSELTEDDYLAVRLRTTIARLLICGLDQYGDNIEISRLYDWLNAGTELRVRGTERWQDRESIHQWIESRPRIQAEIICEAARRCPSDPIPAPYDALGLLYGAKLLPTVFRECIAIAEEMSATNDAAAESILRFVVQMRGIAGNVIREIVAENEEMTTLVNELLIQEDTSKNERQANSQPSDIVKKLRQKDQDEYNALKKLEPEFLRGSVQLNVLHNLAKVFFDEFYEFNYESAIGRINELTMSDETLQRAIRHALESVSSRDDVPDVDETLDLALNSRIPLLGLPFLASIALAENRENYHPSMWSDDQMRTALAVYFGYAHGMYVPLWYGHLVENKPEIVAEVQVKFAAAFLNRGSRGGDTNLSHLAFDSSYASVTEIATLPILRKFPIGARNELLTELEYLLIAAYRHVDVELFNDLITSKLKSKSMPVRQRARWLAAGSVVATDQYFDAANDFVTSGRKQKRLSNFLSLFSPSSRDHNLVSPSNLQLQALLIQVAGPSIGPDEFGKGGWVTIEMDMSRRLRDYIANIANDPSVEAKELLDRFINDPNLSMWHHLLIRRARDQTRVRTDHQFQVPSLDQVLAFLANGLPTNSSDLAALSVSLLEEISESVGRSESDDWKQYWNEDKDGRPTTPKPENSCTKAVLRELKRRLPSGVHCELYGSYSRDTASDLKVIHGFFNVPIEAKRNKNKDLWHATKSQLMTKYTIDPATGGFGIYLVYWFGKDFTQRSPQGTRPETAKDLQRELESSLTEEDRRRISICVIDVSMELPNTQ